MAFYLPVCLSPCLSVSLFVCLLLSYVTSGPNLFMEFKILLFLAVNLICSVTNSAVWESKQSKCKKQEKGDSSKRKYEDYYAFSTPVRGIRSHQVIIYHIGVP